MSIEAVQNYQDSQKLPLSEVVAGNVRARAGRLDISRAELSRVTGITEATVSRKWRGKQAWSIDELERVAEALTTTPEVLMSREYENGPKPKLEAVPGSVHREGLEPTTH